MRRGRRVGVTSSAAVTLRLEAAWLPRQKQSRHQRRDYVGPLRSHPKLLAAWILPAEKPLFFQAEFIAL